MIHRI